MVACKNDPCIGVMVTQMIPVFVKYWSPIPPIFVLAAALDPTQNVRNAELYVAEIKKNFMILRGQEVPEVVTLSADEKCKLNDVFLEYINLDEPERGASQTQRKGKSKMSRFSLRQSTTEATVQRALTELNNYIGTDPIEPGDEWFDVLGYWKIATDKPILKKIARDVLAAQASSCASERCFSASGRVLNPRRMSLKKDILEACVCFKDYFDSTYRIQNKTEEMEMLKKQLILEEEETGDQVPMGIESDNEDEDDDEGSSYGSYPSEEDIYATSDQFYANFNDLHI